MADGAVSSSNVAPPKTAPLYQAALRQTVQQIIRRAGYEAGLAAALKNANEQVEHEAAPIDEPRPYASGAATNPTA
jgi:hypothetical protein